MPSAAISISSAMRAPAQLSLHAALHLLLGEQARLDGLGQLDLVVRGQQRHPADLAQVDPDQVAGDGAPGLGLHLPRRQFL